MPFDLEKASVWKRIAAGLLDFILLVVLSTAFISLISLITGYDKHNQKYQSYIKEYEEEYNTTLNITDDEYNALSREDKIKYDSAYDAFISNNDVLKEYTLLNNLIFLQLSLSFFLSYLILEFILPLFVFKNGITIGKKFFSLGVMKTNGVKINGVSLFIRTFIGKYAIETMVPLLLLYLIFFLNILGYIGLIVILLLWVLEIIVMCVTKTNSLIHDLLSDCVVIDFPSQEIFSSYEEMIKRKEEYYAEKAENKEE